jgi:sugar phosphate isomerase/epimerase
VRYRKDHQPLGKGDLDVNHFLNILIEANFDGPIIFELSSAEALESLAYIRKNHPELLD